MATRTRRGHIRLMAAVVIVAAHPDDEVLGCGGTIARHADAGDEVHIVIVAEGLTSRRGDAENPESAAKLEAHWACARAAASDLGARPPVFLGLPDNRLDTLALLDVVQSLEAEIASIAPRRVYTHHSGDLNIDHEIVHRATLTACRPLPGSSVREIYAYEVLSSTEWGGPRQPGAFAPRHFVDITQTLERKIGALRHYAGEMREFPHPRSYEAVRHLAHGRGAECGSHAAEAFVLIRSIHD